MKRYILFAWMNEPEGGFRDVQGYFDNTEAAMIEAVSWRNWHIVDTTKSEHDAIVQAGSFGVSF